MKKPLTSPASSSPPSSSPILSQFLGPEREDVGYAGPAVVAAAVVVADAVLGSAAGWEAGAVGAAAFFVASLLGV